MERNISIVERKEGEYFVIEMDGNTMDVHKLLVSSDVKPNDVVRFTNGKWHTDEEATRQRKIEMQKLMDELRD